MDEARNGLIFTELPLHELIRFVSDGPLAGFLRCVIVVAWLSACVQDDYHDSALATVRTGFDVSNNGVFLGMLLALTSVRLGQKSFDMNWVADF